MKINYQVTNSTLHLIIKKALPFIGLPWILAGVVILASMHVLEWSANWAIVTALCMEVIGAVGYFTKIKNNG